MTTIPIRTKLRTILVLGLLWACGGMSCSAGQQRNLVAGVITPEHFRFREVVPDNDRSVASGGWRAVCIHALIKQGDSDAKTACQFEVGVPLRTRKNGEVPLEEAQFIAASMANRAARGVLSEAHPGEMLAELCRRFKGEYETLLDAELAGARVSQCKTKNIETVLFGVTGAEPSR